MKSMLQYWSKYLYDACNETGKDNTLSARSVRLPLQPPGYFWQKTLRVLPHKEAEPRWKKSDAPRIKYGSVYPELMAVGSTIVHHVTQLTPRFLHIL